MRYDNELYVTFIIHDDVRFKLKRDSFESKLRCISDRVISLTSFFNKILI